MRQSICWIVTVLFFAIGSLSTTASQAQTKKSLVIGVDGLGYGIFGFDVADTPNMDSLINGTWQSGYAGAYASNAFAGGVLGTPTQQSTVSGPGWSTMLTGVWTNRHNVTGNGNSFSNGDFANNPPYLGAAKALAPGLYTASFVNWNPIDDNIIDAIDSDGNSQNNMNFRGKYTTDSLVADGAAGLIDSPQDPDVIFVSFDEVDIAGHAWGSSNTNYMAQIETTDVYIGRILDAISSRSNFANEDWQIVITADHGHRPQGGHGGQTNLERRIPFIVASKNVGQGKLPAGVSHADIAPTVMDHFGFTIPNHYWGQSRAAGAVNDPRVVAFDDFENLEMERFTVANGGSGDTDWTDQIRTGTTREWTFDNSAMSGSTSELAYYGWTAMDVDSWIGEQGVQIGRTSLGAGTNNTALVADPDAWDDYTTGANQPGFNAYVQRQYDLTGHNRNTLEISFDYEFATEDSQRGNAAVSFDDGQTWQTLIEFDSTAVPDNIFFRGPRTFEAGSDFSPTSNVMLLRFGCVDAANDWWFAVDNILVTTSDGFSDFEDFEGLPMEPFTSSATGDEGTDYSKSIPNWVIDNSGNLGYSEEAAYDGWSALDVASWTAEQGGQGRSIFGSIYPNNTALVADGDAFYDYDFAFNGTDPAPPKAVNSYITRTYDLSGHDNCTINIEFLYEFRIENEQLGVVEVSFDLGETWTRLMEVDNNDGSNNDFLDGTATFSAAADFSPRQTNQMMLRFGYLNADNNWWFAVDDIKITADEIDFVKGDANQDGVTNTLDLSQFVLALFTPEVYEATYSRDPVVVFDFNCDGNFNTQDLAGFVNVFNGY